MFSKNTPRTFENLEKTQNIESFSSLLHWYIKIFLFSNVMKRLQNLLKKKIDFLLKNIRWKTNHSSFSISKLQKLFLEYFFRKFILINFKRILQNNQSGVINLVWSFLAFSPYLILFCQIIHLSQFWWSLRSIFHTVYSSALHIKLRKKKHRKKFINGALLKSVNIG